MGLENSKEKEIPQNSYLLSIPKEIFQIHICRYLLRSEQLRIRISCKYARTKLFCPPFWQLWIPITKYHSHIGECKRIGWKNMENMIYGCYFTSPSHFGLPQLPFSEIQKQILQCSKVKAFDLSHLNLYDILNSDSIFPKQTETLCLPYNVYLNQMLVNLMDNNPNITLFIGTINILCWTAFSSDPLSIQLMEKSLKLPRTKDLVNEPSSSGFYPLYLACQEGSLEKIKLLIENGANVNQLNSPSKKTALWQSLFKKRSDITAFLLQHEANPRIKDSRGESVLDYMKKTKSFDPLFSEYFDEM